MYIRPNALNQSFIQRWKSDINLYMGEFQDEKNFKSIVHGYDVVYHLISSTIPGVINPLQDIETTIKPSLRLLQACVEESVKRVVFFLLVVRFMEYLKNCQYKKIILDNLYRLMEFRNKLWNVIFSFISTATIFR